MIVTKKIGDVFKVTSGGTPSRKKEEYFTDGTIPWVKTGDLKGKFVNTPEEYITALAIENSSAKVFPKNTVLLAMYGATIGACSILPIEAATNQACGAMLPSEECDPTYLYYYLLSIKEELIRKGVGGAQPNISGSIIKDTKIPLPPLDQQKKIASILDAADAYRQKTKALILKYDELTQSLFLDMFGDPVTNPKGWETKELQHVTTKIGSGATPTGGKEAYKSEGISLIRSLNIYDNRFQYKNLAFIDDEQASKLKNVIVEQDDVLFNITGASVCRSTVVPIDVLPARVNQHVSIIRAEKSILHSLFISHLLISESVKRVLLGVGAGGGAVMEAITKKQLQEYKIITPPLDMQNQFAERVQTIEAQKAQAQESLDKAEELFNSLLQKAFKGELV
jgi:type I restriction enzyme S subunit